MKAAVTIEIDKKVLASVKLKLLRLKPNIIEHCLNMTDAQWCPHDMVGERMPEPPACYQKGKAFDISCARHD